MKRTGQYLNEITQKNKDGLIELSEAQRQALKRCLLGIMKDIIGVCEKYNLTIMLSGGSCLGAVRHHGFIPWDDDVDLMMLREDYDKLIEVLPNELGDRYEFSVPKRGFESKALFLKIYKKGTLLSSSYNTTDSFRGVSVDVFPLDNVPDNKIKRYFKSRIAFLLRSIALCVKIYKTRKYDKTRQLMTQTLQSALFYYTCLFVGFLFSYRSMFSWFCLFDRYVKEPGTTHDVTIPAGRAMYNGELLPRSVFVPVSKGIFEGIDVNLPNNTDMYLTNLYGDYMTLPPEEKRERHFYSEFNLGEDFS